MSEPKQPAGEPVAGSERAISAPGTAPGPQVTVDGQPASWALLGLLICAGIFAVGYRVLMHKELGQGAALFIGLPIILGVVVALATAPRSPIGLVLKVTTLCLCILAPLMGEGAICLVMATPLIFGVIGLTAVIIRVITRSTGASRGRVSCCALLVGLSPLLWEPAAKQVGWQDRRPLEEVRTAVELTAPPAAVWSALGESPQDLFAAPLPEFLRLRLHPGPRSVTGRGLQVGATRRIRLDNDQYLGTVTRSVPEQQVTFTVAEEAATAGERIALWLRFVEVEFQLADLGGGRVQLTQVTRYRRLLDPSFYFAPMERWGVRAMHRYTLGLFAHSLSAAAGTTVAAR